MNHVEGRLGRTIMRSSTIAVAAGMTFGATVAGATELGGSSYPVGVEAAFGNALPPGFYNLAYYSHAEARKVVGNRGQNLNWPKYGVAGDVFAYRFQYLWSTPVLGAQAESVGAFPFANVRLSKQTSAAAPDVSSEQTGLADPLLIPLRLVWKGKSVNQAGSIEVVAPLGSYNDARAKVGGLNLGRNYWQIAPTYAFSLRFNPSMNLGVKFRYGFNTKNNVTNYKSGDEFSTEFMLNYQVRPALFVGLQGYYYKQTTNDEVAGIATEGTGCTPRPGGNCLPGTGTGNRLQAMALGPYVRYDVSKFFVLTLKYQPEFRVENKGVFNRLWLQAVLPF